MPKKRFVRSLVIFSALFMAACTLTVNADEPAWQAGIAKVDITPTEPVRMAGYGNRNRPSEGVDSPLSVRCIVLRHHSFPVPVANDHADTLLLVAIDTIGLPGSLAREINQKIEQRFGIPRRSVVLTSTHTHCGPDLISELSNIFSTPLTDDERAAGLRYKAKLVEAVNEAVAASLADLKPANVDYEIGKATFAANRRVLTGGRWTAFGVQPDGPVDHAMPVLRISDRDGKVRGIVFNYACHGTTLSGDHYRINGDWSGFASETLEAAMPDMVALSTIGCGADANPEPRGALEFAVAHGNAMAAEVSRIVAGPMQPITQTADTRFEHAALTFELPTIEEVRQRMSDKNPQISRHATRLDEIYRTEGRLPATYPVPIQSWQFGDQLTMVFVGGEVVVDYALRLKRELANDRLWVTAYAGDVLGYIASERMRQEGGYEFDRSGVYYGLPGPWASGTEDHLIASIRSMLQSQRSDSPVSSTDAPSTMRLSTDQFRIELVAAEPLVQDPINIAFGADGKLWVVEMGDYPLGDRGGRIKYLTDSDGDSRYDTATVFLDKIAFPTGVFPWRDGVIVSAAPDILFARDSTGDGKADQIETLYTGFRLANPQHRIGGFTYGLDHSLHCSSGDNLSELTAVRTGETINASGHDVQIWPDSGRIAVTSGRTQFIRARDDFDQWFGNDNSRPMWHYPIESAMLGRNPAAAQSSHLNQLFSPPVAPPIFPATSSDARFNDLYAAGRFTSACSSIVGRSHTLTIDVFGGTRWRRWRGSDPFSNPL
jgi:putative membrane-bound dehydrogenase-like protein